MSKFTKITQDVPDVNKVYVSGQENYSKPNIKAGNFTTLNKIENLYLQSIEKWSNVFEIDKEIIMAFIATESSGKNMPANIYGATGLMQMTVPAIAESVFKFKMITKLSLPTEAVNFLNKKASFLTKLKSDQLTSSQKKTLKDLLLETDFNIMVGCLYLRWLIEKFKYLNKVLIAYNSGPYNSTLKSYGSSEVSSLELINNKSLPKESRSYVLKMLGVDGFLDLIIVQKK